MSRTLCVLCLWYWVACGPKPAQPCRWGQLQWFGNVLLIDFIERLIVFCLRESLPSFLPYLFCKQQCLAVEIRMERCAEFCSRDFSLLKVQREQYQEDVTKLTECLLALIFARETSSEASVQEVLQKFLP